MKVSISRFIRLPWLMLGVLGLMLLAACNNQPAKSPDKSKIVDSVLSGTQPTVGIQTLTTVIDEGGADDQPGQKDLNQLTIDDGPPLIITWQWDEVGTNGANTLDACSLYDTDGDLLANYALCVVGQGDPSQQVVDSPRLYECTADSRADRCAGATLLATGNNVQSTCTLTSPTGTDPFHPANGGVSDAKASCTIDNSDFGDTTPDLLNVCSYPSQQPNSDPSDCVLVPREAFITVVKVANPNDGTAFDFAFNDGVAGTTDPTPQITGSGTTGPIGVVSGNTYSITETVPTGWTLASISCVNEGGASVGTVNLVNNQVTGLPANSASDITCTFTNNRQTGKLEVVKDLLPDTDPGKFNLFIKDSTATTIDSATDVGDGGTTGENTLNVGTYNISETAGTATTLDDYTSSVACVDTANANAAVTVTNGNVVVGNNQDIVCTFTNTRKTGKLEVVKDIVPNTDTGKFNLFIKQGATTIDSATDIGDGGTTGENTLNLGTYNVSETAGTATSLSDYVSSLACVDTANGNAPVASTGGDVTVGHNQDIVCTFTNTRNATLIIIKNVINDNGGAAVVGDFSGTIGGTATFNGGNTWTGTAAPGQTKTATGLGTYNVVENAASGYTTTYSADCTGTIAVGETKTCTVTNNDQAGSLTIIKNVINNNGGTAAVGDFSGTIGGTATFAGGQTWTGTAAPGQTKTTTGLGTYDVTETAAPGYSVSYSADCTGSIALGETKTCTVTNDDQAASLIIIKNVINDNGGTKVAGNFSGTIGGTATFSGGNTWTGTVAPGQTKAMTTAGTYTVTEAADAGYDTTYSAQCTGTIALGETKTCTVTNNDKPATLTIIKNVINNNGGTAVAGDFSGTIGGAATFAGGNTWTGTVAPGQTKTMTVAGSYTITETAAPGYTTTYSADCTGTIAVGESKTCTVTNDDQAASLIIIKNVINNSGGTAAVGDFSGTISGTATFSGGNTWTGTAAPGQTKAMTAAGTYTVTETAAPGYTTTYSADCTGTIALGQTKTCTVTNDDQAAGLIIIKNVINDNGGSKVAADFSGTISGTATFSGGNTWTGTAAPGQTKTVTGLGSYTVTETADAGYDTTYSADCTGTIGLGETKTCTVTNNDKPATLTIIKNVINDNGGTAIAGDFSGTIGGTAAFNGGNTWTGTAAPGQTKTTTGLGTFTVTETAAPGYTTTYSGDCTGAIALGESKTCTVTNNDQAGSLTIIKNVINNNGGTAAVGDFSGTIGGTATFAGGQTWTGTAAPGQTKTTTGLGTYDVTETAAPGYTTTYSADCTGTIALGQTKTCTVTNDDQGATLKLVKTVVNDNGGTATANDFQAKIDGNNVAWNVAVAVTPGAHTASETTLPGYTASSWGGDCAANGTLNIALGETKTCTITNNDQPAKLKLVKTVINDNGGTATANDFQGKIDGNNVAWNTEIEVTPGAHTASETTLAGYAASAWGGDCAANGTVTAVLGQIKTCTITNDDQAASLIIIKNVINDNGGTKVAGNFSGTISGTATFSGGNTWTGTVAPGQTKALTAAGTYTVTEAADAGYDTTYSAQCTGTIALGETKTCTVTNNDKSGSLIVKKIVINDNGGTRVVSDFGFQVNGGTLTPFEADGQNDLTVNAGIYNVTEPITANYATTYTNCANVVVPNGGSATCTITNNDIAPPVICTTETAFGGNSAGGGPAWWYFFDTQGPSTQNLYAGQTTLIGTVTWNGTTLTISLTGGWQLRNVKDPVKVEGYNNLPPRRPAAGQFRLYRGTSLTITGNGSRYYVIHLDVQKCQ